MRSPRRTSPDGSENVTGCEKSVLAATRQMSAATGTCRRFGSPDVRVCLPHHAAFAACQVRRTRPPEMADAPPIVVP